MRIRAILISTAFGLSGWTLAQDHSAHHKDQAPQAEQQQQKEGAPLLRRLGSHHCPVSTKQPQAQKYFDQGLLMLYAFNHGEAIRSFQEAARLDPQCAMAYWGVSIAHGPNINQPMTPDRDQPAWEALQKAQQLAPGASEKEQALIRALAKRYAEKPPQDRAPLDLAYADAMRQVARQYPDDVDVQSLFAESLMDTMPWEYWLKDGQPKPATTEVLAALEKVLQLEPDHPGANHYYIHAVEASPNPERGLASAHRLRQLNLDAGHLVHMPAHIYLKLGMYHDAVLVNEDAIKADQSYTAQCAAQGYYPKLYIPHNIHFLWYCQLMEGRSQDAMAHARQTARYVGEQHTCAVEKTSQSTLPLLTMVRFGQWDALLAEPEPKDANLYAQIIRHYTRGLAQAAKANVDDAQAELKDLRKLAASDQAKTLDEPFFPGQQIVAVADHVLAGEIAAKQGRHDQAIELLQKAVQLEDDLPYMEPPYWTSPTRQTLGAILLDARRPADAEATYREDLKKHPDNGWSLFGLLESLRAQGKSEDAQDVEGRFQRAWANADVALTGSRY